MSLANYNIRFNMPQLWSGENDNQQTAGSSLWKPPVKESTEVRNDGQLLSPGGNPKVRRLSSNVAGLNDLSLGPSVVVPPKDLHKPSDAHETAAALELAKHRLNIGDGVETPTTPPETTTTDNYAFGFDIDGVLIRGGQPIPEAIEAMKVLNGQNEWGIKVLVFEQFDRQCLSDQM